MSLPKEFSATELRKRFEVPSVHATFTKLDLTMFRKLLPSPLFPSIKTKVGVRSGRNTEKYHVPYTRLSKVQSFFFVRASKLANEYL